MALTHITAWDNAVGLTQLVNRGNCDGAAYCQSWIQDDVMVQFFKKSI